MNLAVIDDCKMTHKKLHNERLETQYILGHKVIWKCVAPEGISSWYKIHKLDTWLTVELPITMHIPLLMWVVGDVTEYGFEILIFFIAKYLFCSNVEIFHVYHRSDHGKGEKILFSLTLSSNQHYFDELLTNIKWYLYSLSLGENGIFHYSKSEFLPTFRCSPLQSAIRHRMPQHNPPTANYRKQLKHLPR